MVDRDEEELAAAAADAAAGGGGGGISGPSATAPSRGGADDEDVCGVAVGVEEPDVEDGEALDLEGGEEGGGEVLGDADRGTKY